MDDIRQSTIDNLSYLLTEKEIITKDGNSIKFSSNSDETTKGSFLINDIKKGLYNIFFVKKLTLTLTATNDFKFKNASNHPSNSIAISSEKNSSSDIVDLLQTILSII